MKVGIHGGVGVIEQGGEGQNGDKLSQYMCFYSVSILDL